MIDRLKIQNYRCFRELDVPLAPFTVLIGPNNSGKSAFLSALGKLQLGHESKAISENDRWMFLRKYLPSITYFDNGTEVTLTEGRAHNGVPSNAWKRSDNPKGPNPFWPVRFFGGELLDPSMNSPGVTEREGVPELDDEVKNLPAYLDSLLRRDRSRFQRVLDTLRRLVPGFEDLIIATPDASRRRIDLVLDNGMIMNADLASYGVRLLIFFVALANHPSPPYLVLLEEPENGVHPKRLKDIVDLLSGLSQAKYADRPTQVVLTTHSPYLLDYIDLSKDQVLVAQRTDDGSRQVAPISKDRLAPFLDEFMLGEVWLNQGESGLLRKDS